MQRADLFALGPLLILAAATAVVMLQIALMRRHALTVFLTLTGLVLATISLVPALHWTSGSVTPLITIDPFALFYMGLILMATAASAALGHGYLCRISGHCEEFYLLLLLAALGACVLAASRHFAAFFIGLEILSISLYALIAYTRRRMVSVEAGLKYLILAAASAAVLLFGMALIYADTGTLDFAELAGMLLSSPGRPQSIIAMAGLAMLLVGTGFKLALVPFHMWTPDVYQGAPAPVTAFVATVSKAAMVALLLRLLIPLDLSAPNALFRILAVMAVASMVAGNLLALLQNQVKRILAYSSIAHMGYLLVAFLSGGRTAVAAVTFYMVAYTVTTIGSFGVVSVLSHKDGDADDLAHFRGLAFRHPWLGVMFMASLLSLAGIPLTVGFMGKFYLVAAGAHSYLWGLVLTLVITSGIGLFYYLRIVVVLFSPAPEDGSGQPPEPIMGFPNGVALTTMALLLIWLGVMPDPLLRLIHSMLGG